MKLFKNTLIAAAVLSASSLSFAVNTTGNVSNGNASIIKYVKVGDTINKKHPEYNGMAGINIVYKTVENDGSNTANNKFQSFDRIRSMADKPVVNLMVRKYIARDKNDVYVGHAYDMPDILFKLIKRMPEHRDLGAMSFRRVDPRTNKKHEFVDPSMDVWFGDWVDVPRNSQDPEHEASKYTVYYAGTGQTATSDLPTGKVTYTITGINNHRNIDTPVLKGKMKADFDNHFVKGKIKRSDLTITFNGKIEGAGFNGNATANGTIHGQSEGKFYGAQAAGVAGMATFASDHSKDTAFGGTKMKRVHR